MAAIAITFPAASAVPSPLYVVYQDQWGFPDSTLTEVFAIYALALLASLLVFGAISDHVGRRPVLLVAIFFEAVSVLLFLAAGDVNTLAVARVVQGFATGAAISTLGAVVVDLQPKHAPKRGGVVTGIAPLAGLALGALGCGLLIQLAPAPTSLVFVVLLGALAISAVAVWFSPETSTMRPGARQSLRLRVALPSRLRKEIMVIVPILIAGWALGGLYLSLGPSIAGEMLGIDGYLVGGIVVCALCGTGALTAFLLREREPEDVLLMAAGFLIFGMLITLTGLNFGILAVALTGTMVAGIGFGATALGGFGCLSKMAEPHERGQVLALGYVIGYLAYSLPAVAGGFAASEFGLHGTALVYGAAIVVLALLAFWWAGAERRLRRTAAST